MDVTPTIKAAETRISSEGYQDYLKTPAWRQTRGKALRAANFQCSKCLAKRQLEVHHKTYERLGHERPEDLEVVCSGCHKGHHFNQFQTELGVFSKLVSEALKMPGVETVTDVREAVMGLCRLHKVKYEVWQCDEAINRIAMQRLEKPKLLPVPDKALRNRPAEWHEQIGQAEAAGILATVYATVGKQFGVKHMPQTSQTKAEQDARMEILQAQKVQIARELKARRRKSFADRLDEIFSEAS